MRFNHIIILANAFGNIYGSGLAPEEEKPKTDLNCRVKFTDFRKDQCDDQKLRDEVKKECANRDVHLTYEQAHPFILFRCLRGGSLFQEAIGIAKGLEDEFREEAWTHICKE